MKPWISAMATAAAMLAANPAVSQTTSVLIGSGTGTGATATSWWQTTGPDGVTEVVIGDAHGQRWRYRCPPGTSIGVVRNGGDGVATMLQAGSGAGGIFSSVTVGGGRASATTVLGLSDGVTVMTGRGDGAGISVTCR